MAKSIHYSQVFEAIMKGVKKSQRTYEKVSGQWVWTAPEYYTTVRIFDELAKVVNQPRTGIHTITLEEPVREVIKWASDDSDQVNFNGLDEEKVRIKGKVDICVWDANEQPRGIIEVKISDKSSNEGIQKDIERICEMLEYSNYHELSIKYGAIAVYLSNTAKKTKNSKECLEDRINSLEKLIVDLLPEEYQYVLDISQHGNKDDAWASFVAMIFPEQ